MDDRYLISAYMKLPTRMVRGVGVFLYDEENNRYLDFASGIAVNNLGHAHPDLHNALVEQSSRLWHCSNLFNVPMQNLLAEKLVQLTFADKVFFCSSGLEASEAAIKFIRKYHYCYRKRSEPCKILTIEGGFHGRSIAAISAINNPSACDGYGPLLTGFQQIPRNDIDAFKQALDDSVGGVMLEIVQSEGGVHPLQHEYIAQIRTLTKERDIILCFDEVQTGYGRTGSLFAYQGLNGIEAPDMITTAKGMGNGFPLGACLATEKLASVISPGQHGSTYGGNPLAMSVGLKVLEIISAPEMLRQVAIKAQHLRKALQPLKSDFPHLIQDVRGKGMMIGIELHCSATKILKLCLKNRLVTSKCGRDRVLRLMPPLITSEEQIDQASEILYRVFSQL